MPRFWQLPSCSVHCGGTEYRLRCVALLGVNTSTLYKGLRKAVSTTDFVKTPLINYNKYDHMFRLDIKLPSDYSNICTQKKQHNYTYILINTKYEGLYVMQFPLCMLLWHEDSLMSNRNMYSHIYLTELTVLTVWTLTITYNIFNMLRHMHKGCEVHRPHTITALLLKKILTIMGLTALTLIPFTDTVGI